DPFEALRREVQRYRAPEIEGMPRFFGGAVGFLAYDIVRYFERLPNMPHDDLGVPDLYMMFTDTLLVFDNVRQTLKIIANIAMEDFSSTATAYRAAQVKIEQVLERLKTPAQSPRLSDASLNGADT